MQFVNSFIRIRNDNNKYQIGTDLRAVLHARTIHSTQLETNGINKSESGQIDGFLNERKQLDR